MTKISDHPKVSIITVSFNSAETIEDTIKSVISQDYDPIEYIIIDGGSNDQTLEIINKYKDKIALVVSEPDNGIYDAMNKGVDRATGELIGILNSDDLYAQNQVISKIVALIKKTGAEAAYADLLYVDRVHTDVVKRYWVSGEYKRTNFQYGWMPPHPTFFTLKSCYDKLGDYNLKLRSAADYELMLRFLYKSNVTPVYLPEITIKMRVGGQSNVTLNNRLKANKEDRLAWEMNGLKPSWYTLKLKPIRKIMQFIRKPKQ